MSKPSKNPELIEKALEMLLIRIYMGQEYPDAHTGVAFIWNVDSDLLQQRYDEYCAAKLRKEL